jgi:hypothetical protein
MSPGRNPAWILVGILIAGPAIVLMAWVAGALPRSPAPGALLAAAAGCCIAGIWLARVLLTGAAVRKSEQAQQDQLQREALAMEVLMAQPLVQVKPARATLRLGEYAYGALQAGMQPIQDAAIQAPGGRGSKKIAFRSGETPDGSIPKSTLIATGELVISDQRVIFTSDAKTLAIALDQLMSVTKYSDGFAFEDGKSRYELLTAPGDARTAFAQALYKITQR